MWRHMRFFPPRVCMTSKGANVMMKEIYHHEIPNDSRGDSNEIQVININTKDG